MRFTAGSITLKLLAFYSCTATSIPKDIAPTLMQELLARVLLKASASEPLV